MNRGKIHIIIGAWVGGLLFGSAAFFLSCYAIGVNPLQTRGKDIQETIGTAGHFKILAPSILALIFGMLLGASIAASIWRRGE